MISWYVTQASTYARDIDNLILLVGLVVGFFFLVAEVVFFWLILRFRARPGGRGQYVTGEEAHQKKWVAYPHYLVLVFDVIIVVAALRVWNTVKIDMPQTQERVRIIAQQWAWTFKHAGPDGQLDTADDVTTVDELNLQVNRRYEYELHSKDVLHSFSVPVFRLKQDAVPGRVIRGWFEPTVTGEFDIQCAEICGIGHGLMPARVRIRSAADQAAWLASPTSPAAVAAGVALPSQPVAIATAAAEHLTHSHAQGHPGSAQ
jgi:cytochrome c oxidase subunit 2